MQQRKERGQEGPSSIVVDLFPGKPRYTQQDSPAPSSIADSHVDILGDAGVNQDGVGACVPSNEVSITGVSHLPVDSPMMQKLEDDGMESNDEADSQKAVINSPTDPCCTIAVRGIEGTNHDTPSQGVGTGSPFDRQEHEDTRVVHVAQRCCASTAHDAERRPCRGVLGQSGSIKVNETTKSRAVLAGGGNLEAIKV